MSCAATLVTKQSQATIVRMVAVTTLLLIFRLLPSVVVMNPSVLEEKLCQARFIGFEEYLDITTAAGKRVASALTTLPTKKGNAADRNRQHRPSV